MTSNKKIIVLCFLFKSVKSNILPFDIMERENNEISDWQGLVNKPVYSNDAQEVGIVTAIQPQHIVVSYGPITTDKYLIPKSSVKNVERGIIYLNEDTKFVEDNYRFE
ncbi:MAG TPA: hypothetical protein VE573_03145 [Nitrososphaeraceae archaeon]|nr:hypothetical protein [Nitrososphaeraceae archaeon]